MENWYVLKTLEKREKEAADLLMRVVDRSLWSECRVLQKKKVFRTRGELYLVEDILFPGYLLIKTETPARLTRELQKSRQFPQMIRLNCKKNQSILVERTMQNEENEEMENNDDFVMVDTRDMIFLQNICGRQLQKTMGVTEIFLDENNQIVRADGILQKYLDRVVKLNLHKRFAIVEIPLFNRVQSILFGIRLSQDKVIYMGKE